MKGKDEERDKQKDTGVRDHIYHGYELKTEEDGTITWEYVCNRCFRQESLNNILEAPPIEIGGRYKCCRCGESIEIA